jgi:hypothetical protein
MNDFQQLTVWMVCLAAVVAIVWLVRPRQH